MWRRRRRVEAPTNDWMRLATYNAEVARGIVHTPEWNERMHREQAIFDREQRRKVGVSTPPPPMPKVPKPPATERRGI